MLISIFRVTAWLEGLSFIVLLGIAMPLKYLAGDPSWVKVVGMAHGVLFVAYGILAYALMEILAWRMKTFGLAILASLLPFGTFVFERKYLPPSKSAT